MKQFAEWLKDNWQYSAILVLIYTVAMIIPLYWKLELSTFLLLLAFPLYLVHEIEEYILPGGFADFFNGNLLKKDTKADIVPIDREVVFWINLIYIWLTIPLCVALSFVHLAFAAWIPYFFFFQAIGHLGMGILGKRIINPGIMSSFVLHIPYAILLISLLQEKAFENPYFNIYMIIGFLFNLILPLLAKFVILPRYHRRFADSN